MRRPMLVGIALLVAYSGIIVRLLQLQVLQHGRYAALCRSQRRGYRTIPARRGDITTFDGTVVARSIPSQGLFIDSAFVQNPETLLAVLKPILHLTDSEVSRILASVRKRKRFIWVRRCLTGRQQRVIRALKLRGVFFTPVWRRVYPLGAFAASVVGFCGVDGQGLSGIEFWAERWLRGRDGRQEYERDGCGRHIFLEENFTPPEDGAEVVLTVDGVVQDIVENVADDVVERWNPGRVTIVVAEPGSGNILALASRPTFNPSDWRSSVPQARRNPAAEFIFEPGSTFKAITFAALLQERLIRLEEEIDCERGAWRVGRRILHDHRGHDILPVPDVLAKSSNIGTAKLALRMEPALHYRWLRRFGFGQKTGVELPHEECGVLRPVARWSRYSQVSLAIGQEIGVTVLQMVRAFCAIANGGVLLPLHIVAQVVGRDGKVLFRPRNKRRRIMASETAATLRKLLLRVVEEGTGRRARSRLYTIAGKTGTAQKLDRKTGRYSETDYVASFICMAPAKRPRIVVAVVVDTPRGSSHFGGTVAAPYAKTIIEQVLPYLGVGPDKEDEDGDWSGSCRR